MSILFIKLFWWISQKQDLQKHEIGALILSPTRELASQISEVLEIFLKNLPQLKQQMFIGGSNSTVNNDIAKVTKFTI